MHVLATDPDPDIVRLPWKLPLEEWAGPWVLDLPRGLSRHVVRLVRAGERIVAVKETDARIAQQQAEVRVRGLREGIDERESAVDELAEELAEREARLAERESAVEVAEDARAETCRAAAGSDRGSFPGHTDGDDDHRPGDGLHDLVVPLAPRRRGM